jgi:hypothetical protein
MMKTNVFWLLFAEEQVFNQTNWSSPIQNFLT